MGLLSFGFGKTTPTGTTISKNTTSKDIVARYKRLRTICSGLHDEFVGRFPDDVIRAGAEKLGILHDGALLFQDENQMSVLMDYCVYDVFHNDRNAVEQYLCECPPEADSEETECLHAMQHASYTVLAVLDIEPKVGCHVRNLFTGETQLVVDISFSESAVPGLIIATRLLEFGDFVITSGVALPMGILDCDEIDEWQGRVSLDGYDGYIDPAPLILDCFDHGASSRVRFEEPSMPLVYCVEPSHQRRPERWRVPPPTEISDEQQREIAKRRINPKRRCRCGSGKMFKNCCGKQ
jgi:hypothetical protein